MDLVSDSSTYRAFRDPQNCHNPMLSLRHAHVDFRPCRQVACARCRGRRGSALAFPCCFPAKPVAGKMFSLPAGSGKLAQRFDVTPKFWSNREDFEAETKIFPAVSRSAGKIALAGVHARRLLAAPLLACRRPATPMRRRS